MVNRTDINSAQSNFLEYQPSLRNIIRCQVPSRVRAWFHDSAGDNDFNQMSLSHQNQFFLHESTCIIF